MWGSFFEIPRDSAPKPVAGTRCVSYFGFEDQRFRTVSGSVNNVECSKLGPVAKSSLRNDKLTLYSCFDLKHTPQCPGKLVLIHV